tara:strand:- start:7271 stop:8092 length:822 start_codon:yes stop_codon:yes gene_type:complete
VEKNIMIPSSFDNMPVLQIGRLAFSDKQLTNVIIANSISSIGSLAFKKNELTNVILPNSITSIGYYVFSENEFEYFNLPSNHQNFTYTWSEIDPIDGSSWDNVYESGDSIPVSYIYEYSKGQKIEPIYHIEYVLNNGTADNPSTYLESSEIIQLNAAFKDGSEFAGWFRDSEFTQPITEILSGSIGDIEVFARFIDEIVMSLNLSANSQLSLYPNPSSTFIYVQMNTGDPFLIYSLDGTLMLSSENSKIDVSRIVSGVYLLKQGEQTARFVKE